ARGRPPGGGGQGAERCAAALRPDSRIGVTARAAGYSRSAPAATGRSHQAASSLKLVACAMTYAFLLESVWHPQLAFAETASDGLPPELELQALWFAGAFG